MTSLLNPSTLLDSVESTKTKQRTVSNQMSNPNFYSIGKKKSKNRRTLFFIFTSIFDYFPNLKIPPEGEF